MSLFGDILLDPESQTIKRGLKWITRELGSARELDIFIKRVVMPANAGKSQQPGVAALNRDLRRRQRQALGHARSAIESDRFRILILDTAAWIECGDWTNNANDLVRALQELPIATAAAAEMERRYRKIVKRGTKLLELDPVRRHEIRIQAKKLRYACEFFGSTFPGKKATRRRKGLSAALEQLQDTLGDLNDITVHEGLAERLADTQQSGKRKHRTSHKAFAAGRLSGREEARTAPSLRTRSGPTRASRKPNHSGGSSR